VDQSAVREDRAPGRSDVDPPEPVPACCAWSGRGRDEGFALLGYHAGEIDAAVVRARRRGVELLQCSGGIQRGCSTTKRYIHEHSAPSVQCALAQGRNQLSVLARIRPADQSARRRRPWAPVDPEPFAEPDCGTAADEAVAGHSAPSKSSTIEAGRRAMLTLLALAGVVEAFKWGELGTICWRHHHFGNSTSRSG